MAKKDLSHLQNEFYEKKYEELMGTGLISRIWAIIHKKMEKPFRNQKYSKILEIGSGNGEHFKYVNCEFENYYATDIRITRLKKAFANSSNVTVLKADAESLPFPDEEFDRIIVTCVLAHLKDPIKSIEEIFRVLKPKGVATIYLPCEPGILLRTSRALSTRLKARRIGVNHIVYLHFIEHRNYFSSIDYFLKFHSMSKNLTLKSRFHPFRFLSWNFNLYKIYNITK